MVADYILHYTIFLLRKIYYEAIDTSTTTSLVLKSLDFKYYEAIDTSTSFIFLQKKNNITLQLFYSSIKRITL